MADPNFDLEEAHKFFAAHCFNQAWSLIDKEIRTREEEEQMVLLNQASLWHWTQREDCSKRNLSVGYWQAARIHALIGDVDCARRAATLSLENTSAAEPFYLGYAYEALARAEVVAGNLVEAKKYLSLAQELLDRIADADEKKYLGDDLSDLGGKLS